MGHGREAAYPRQNDENPALAGFSLRADDGARTRDTWLGKPVLYQLSYVRAKAILAAP